MLVKSAMTTGKIYTLTPKATFSEIVEFLIKHKISAAPVVNKKGKLVGIVSEKDLFYHLFPSEEDFYRDPDTYMDFDIIEEDAQSVRKLKAKDLMTTKIIKISPEDHILKSVSLFIKHKIRRLPVVREGKLVGILTTNDVYRRFLKLMSKKV